jgi:hypothetical protein
MTEYWTPEENAAFLAAAEPSSNGDGPHREPSECDEVAILSLEEFIAEDEPDAVALVGDTDAPLIAEGTDVMFYCDGGAGKTTLCVDLAFHLGTGRDWLGMSVARPVNVLLIECEGPRPLYRKKLKRKQAAWDGPSLDGRVAIFAKPWAKFRFDSEEWRARLISDIRRFEIDVVIAGPLVQLGMDAAGTMQEVRAFMRLVNYVRDQCGRPLTVVLAHHENKGGSVSGAWEGAGDCLLHTMEAGNGHTIVYVQKARWSSALHHTTLKLAWTAGEGFEIETAADALALMLELDQTPRTVDEIRQQIGVGTQAVRDMLAEHEEKFEHFTGADSKTFGRSPTAHLYRPKLEVDWDSVDPSRPS